MRRSPRSLQWDYLLLCLGFLFHYALGSAEEIVHTEAPAGPLYRTEGSSLFISCSVTGLTPALGDNNTFEYVVKKPTHSIEYRIISTNEKDFGFAVYQTRVRNGEITLKNADPNSVVFEIQRLQKADEGDYECHVKNPEGRRYFGTYSAFTEVKVIDNSLSVSSSAPASLTRTEGDDLALTCEVSSNTVQHTHLSVAWFLRKNSQDAGRPLISMDKDFTLIPGQSFEERYKAGLIRLDKIGEVTYRLKMSHLEKSDEGALYCEAQEWIQDPDRSWYSIVQKAAGETDLTVKAKEVLSDASALVVRISVPQTILQEGQQLTVSCRVDTLNLKERFFSVAWLCGEVELARVGPTGVLSTGPDYNSREKEGELRAARIGDADYRLILQPIRTSDQGEYICRAWPEDRSQTGVFTQGAAHDSTSQTVSISAIESGLTVKMASHVKVNEGEKLVLFCNVSGATGQLSVTWQHKPTPSAPFTSLLSLSRDGVLTRAEGTTDVRVKALRPAPDLFTLELEGATQSDSGVYQCDVSEWGTSDKASRQLGTSNVDVTSLESFVKLHLTGRNIAAAEGQEVELICRVRELSLPRTLTWSLRRRDSQVPDSILTLYSTGEISWSGSQQLYQLKITKQMNNIWYHLIINGASKREAGNYQCSMSVVLEKSPRKLHPSNELAVSVRGPVSDLSLTTLPSIRANINSDIELKCSVSSNIPTLSRYAVTWLLQQQRKNRTIVTSDQDALVTFGPDVESSQKQRISVSRTKGPSFVLTIRNTRSSDQGLYICEVTEWQQDPRHEWNRFPPVSKSTQLTIIEPASDLLLNETPNVLNVEEGDEVELQCSLISVVDIPSFFYKVIWLYSGHSASITNVPLVELDHTGLLTYPVNQNIQKLQERLRLHRPTQSSFHLGIQMVREDDTGTFVCRVEQYQLDRDGQWQQKASNETSRIPLYVNVTEKNLFILSNERKLNISTSQNLPVPCNITQQSSPQSEFQVTWFWQKETDNHQHPLFTVYRNATLQYWFGKNEEQLRFGHPLPNHFSLTILRPDAADSGQYFCEVEEWVPSLSRGWRKVAVERSGYLTATFYTEEGLGAVSEPMCNSPQWIGAFVGVSLLLLLLIALLVLRTCRGNRLRKKKNEPSLWTESHQLNPKELNNDNEG